MKIEDIIKKENPTVEEIKFVLTNYIFDKKGRIVTIDFHPLHFPLLMTAYESAKSHYELQVQGGNEPSDKANKD